MPRLPSAVRSVRRKVVATVSSHSPDRIFDRIEAEPAPTGLRLAVVPSGAQRVVAVWAQGPIGWTRLADASADASADGGRYVAEIDLTPLAGAAPTRYVLHAEVEPADGGASRRRPLAEARHTVLGRFPQLELRGCPVTVAPLEGGALAVTVGEAVPPFGSMRVSVLRLLHGTMYARGRISTHHGHLTGATFVLRGRTSDREIRYPVPFTFDARRTAASSGLRFYRYALRIDFRDLLADPGLTDDFFDAYVLVSTEEHPEPHQVRVGRTPFVTRYLTNNGWTESGGRALVINPYYTFKAKRTSFQLSVLDADSYRYLRRATRTRHLLRLRHGRREVWLVGERAYKAQDTGYHFFRHLRTAHPEVEAYYVVERDSPERANVAPLGNVLDFGSREHIATSLIATKVAGSHHADFLYPLRTKEFRRAVRAAKIFLQHGVMGTKWMANLYGKGVGNFDTDLFIVSSTHERDYIAADFGFDHDEIAITGLSRFDALFAGDVPVRAGQVLVMPTWRDWLQDRAGFLESEYFQRWSEFLQAPQLRALEERYGLEVIFCLHPNMQQFRASFESDAVRVVNQGDVDIQFLLKQSTALVTDYSSVGFDFSFLDKPVFYYQFDRDRFLGEEGSHLDLDEELPGQITWTATELLAALAEAAAAGFPMPAEYARRAARFLDHRDRDSSERIYQAARTVRRRRRLGTRFVAHPVVAAGWRFLRRSRYYFPAMRLMYRALLHLPADPRLVLFESGLGRQYADSPRYVYEELVRRGTPLKKVWAYDRRIPGADAETKVVPRLSPAYFYYLARARYWVNNQSFPHYVRRRPDGVFVQTWHGTPLKRMLHDLPEVHGRDGGYAERATRGAEQWSVLVSPNGYTTERMRSAFRYRGEALEVGYPRNDILHAPDRAALAARIRRRLGVRADQRVVLYAPTFRDDQTDGTGRFTFQLPFDLDRLHQALGPDTVVLLRMHVLVREAVTIPVHLRDVVRDVSTYPEMQELYLASDVLVTDYSSVFFDFAQLRRPMVFYAYDLASYRDTLRGFYLDYATELPGPIVETEDDLIDALTSLDRLEAEYGPRREEFIARFAPDDDGQAAARVVDAIWGRPGDRPGTVDSARECSGPPPVEPPSAATGRGRRAF